MDRRSFLKTSLAAGIAGTGLITSAVSGESKNLEFGSKPNIIFMLVDDLGWDEPGCYGGRTKMKTPNIDTLASQGVRFTHATGCAFCSPARAALMSGRYGFRTGINANICDPGGIGREFKDDEILVSQTMQNIGYKTGLFGKLHLHWNSAQLPDLPQKMGFDYSFHYAGLEYDTAIQNTERRLAQSGGGMVYDHFNVPWYENGKPYKDDRYDTEVMTDKAIEFIKSSSDKPFMMWMPYFAIHEPFTAPKEWVDKYPVTEEMRADFAENVRKARIRGKRLGRAGLAEWNPPIEQYRSRLAMGSCLDAYIGRLLEVLDKNGLAENTVVILTSDNGPHPYAGGGKGEACDMGIRVPLIIRWPKRIKPGMVSDALVENVDIYPTIVEIAGGEMPDSLKFDGRSLLPVIDGKTPENWRKYSFNGIKGSLALMDKDWFYTTWAENDDDEKIWSRITPPDSVQEPVPMDLVPQDVLKRFRAEMAKYRAQWQICMSQHRKELQQRRQENKDFYGDRYKEIHGVRR
jgi:arylsulfatase A